MSAYGFGGCPDFHAEALREGEDWEDLEPAECGGCASFTPCPCGCGWGGCTLAEGELVKADEGACEAFAPTDRWEREHGR